MDVRLRSRARLEAAMRRADLSGAELAKLVGVTRSTISNLRTGKTRRTRAGTARAVEAALRVEAGHLFHDGLGSSPRKP